MALICDFVAGITLNKVDGDFFPVTDLKMCCRYSLDSSMNTLMPDDLVRLEERGITLLAPSRPTGEYERGPTQYLAEIDSHRICHAIVIDFDESDRRLAEEHWASQLEL